MPETERLNVKITGDASELEKESNKALSAIEKIKSRARSLKDFLSSAFSQSVDESSLTGYEKRLQYIKTRIADLTEQLRQADEGIDIGIDVFKVEAEIERLQEQLARLQSKSDETKDEINGDLDQVSEKTKEVKHNFGNLFKSVDLSGIKKIGMALMGVRTVFAAIRKAMNAYLSQNDTLRAKIDGI